MNVHKIYNAHVFDIHGGFMFVIQKTLSNKVK